MYENVDNQGSEFKEMLEKLRTPLPNKLIKQRMQGGSEIDYITWTTASDILDQYVSNYTVDIGKMLVLGDYVVIEVGITINGERRANIGSEKLSHKGYGDPFTNAFAQAFKRAAALWGLARNLYQEEDVSTIIKDNSLKVKEKGRELVEVAFRRGYDDERLFMQLLKKFKEPNPFKLTLEQLTTAIEGISKLPIVMDNDPEGATNE